MNQIESLIEGNEIVYEDEQDIVRFSATGGKVQKTITYKKDWIDNKGQPVKAGDVVQITGDEAIAELLKDRQYLSYFKVEESAREVSEEEKKKNRDSLSGIQPLIEGNELVYEDEQDIVRFSVAGGKLQKTITYKKDWTDNKGQPVEAGDVVQITGDEAIAELLNDREYLSYFKVEEAVREVSKKSDLSDRITSRALTFEEMRDASLKGKRGNFNLDQAIQAILEYKARGESVSYRFNGFKLESDRISKDDIERIHEEYGKALSSKLPRELYDEEIRDTSLKGKRGNFNLEQAVRAMLEYKSKGESVYYIFKGFELNSDEITTVEETIEKYDRFLKRDREPQKTIDTAEGLEKKEEIDSEGIILIDETKFAQIYGKAKGRIKEVFSKIKSFLNIKSNDRNDKTNDKIIE